MKLVIVESPAKCKTIGKYLGNDYRVMASYGHIRDLAIRGKGGLGVDLENNYAPIYVNDSDKEKVIKELTKASKEAEEVILATDPDREGEAIAWHLAMVLGLPVETTRSYCWFYLNRYFKKENQNGICRTCSICNLKVNC